MTPNGLNQGGWDVIYKGHSHSNYIFCKFIQTLGGVMKYILITLLSFTFATQITTREFIVSIVSNSNSTINPSEISGLSNGKLEVGGLTAQNTQFHMYDSYYIQEINCFTNYEGDINCESYFGDNFLFNENSEYSINCDSDCEVKFWITGAFEDEDTSMGDMNNDGSLNVYDVLIMVGIILDGDSGDIFDVMEIIKRV